MGKTTLLVLANTLSHSCLQPLKDSKERCSFGNLSSCTSEDQSLDQVTTGSLHLLPPAHRQSTTWTQAVVRQEICLPRAAHSPLAEESSSFPLSLIRYASQVWQRGASEQSAHLGANPGSSLLTDTRDVPGDPVVKTSSVPYRGHRFGPRSHLLHTTAK